MKKLDDALPPPSMEQLATGAFLSHLDHCVACSKKVEELHVEGLDLVRTTRYTLCVIGKFLGDLVTEAKK